MDKYVSVFQADVEAILQFVNLREVIFSGKRKFEILINIQEVLRSLGLPKVTFVFINESRNTLIESALKKM